MVINKTVSIIIVNYNGKDFIANCLESLESMDYPKNGYEVILVDNASKDGSVEIVRKFPSVKLISLDRNVGFSAGNNIGVDVAHGDYVVFLNPDTEVDKRWLTELVKKISSEENIGAVSSKVIYSDDRNTINTVGGWWSVVGIPGSLGDGMKVHDVKGDVETFFPTGCSMIMSKDFYETLGGFDNDYFLYCEDADLGWRIWNKNYRVVLAANSIVYHKSGGSIKGLGKRNFNEMYYFYSTRNRLTTILKNSRLVDLIWMLPLYYLSHLVWAVLFTMAGNLTAAKATIKGVWLRDSQWYNKRKTITRNGYANSKMLGIVETLKMFLIKKRKHLK